MADVIVARGVKQIDDGVIGDDSFFAYDPYPAEWSGGDLYFAYGAPLSAIALNDNSIAIQVSPGLRVGDPAVFVVTPWPGYESFGHNVVTSTIGSKTQLAVVSEP